MVLKVAGQTIDKFENINVTLMFNSVVSTFSFDLYFDPYNKVHRQIFLPFAYNQCEVVANSGETLIKGVIYSPSFKSSSKKHLTNITGCSLAGVLRDCNYLQDGEGNVVFAPQVQFNGKSLLDIAQTICDAFALPLTVDKSVLEDARKPYTTDIDAQGSTNALAYLTELANERNIILSHTKAGGLWMTRAIDQAPVFDFSGNSPDYEIELLCNGQEMHSTITCLEQGQAPVSINNPYVIPKLKPQFDYNERQQALDIQEHKSPDVSHKNSFVMAVDRKKLLAGTAYRPTSFIKRTGEQNALTVNAELAKELKAIQLKIYIKGWQLPVKQANGETKYILFQPNTYITVKDDECFLFKKTKFFIESVAFTGNAASDTCVLNCVVPEVYNGQPPVNIFINQPAPIAETDRNVGSALPLGFNGFNNFTDL